MNTPEQQASEMLVLGVALSEKDMQALHDWAIKLRQPIIAERDALKAELAAINGAGKPVAWIVRKVDWSERMSDVIRGSNPPAWADVAHPLYTRPAVPLTDEKVKELICEHFVTGENQFNEVHQDYRFRSPATERNVWGRDLLKFARAIEAHIKGAKG